MTLLEHLRAMVDAMPPGASVSLPCDWLREALAREQGGEAPNTAANTSARDLTVAEVAERVRRHPNTVRDWLRSEALRGYLLNGRDWRIPEAALAEYLEAQKGERPQPTRSGRPANLGAWRGVRKAG